MNDDNDQEDSVEQLRSHKFGFVPESVIRLVEQARDSADGGASLAGHFLVATIAQHWDSIRPEEIPVHTPMSHCGLPMNDEARAADAEARRDAHAVLAGDARWLLPALQHAGAELMVAPGFFAYMLPGERGAHFLPGLGDQICPSAKARTVLPPRERDPNRWREAEALPLGVITFHRIGRPGKSYADPIDDDAARADDRTLQHLACEAADVSGLLPLFQQAPATLVVLPGRLLYSLGAAPLPMIEIPASWANFAEGTN